MPSQKIPLFDGVMKPVGAPVLAPVTLFTPPDKNLKDGTQAFYEVHMWVVPSPTPAAIPLTGDSYGLLATQDGSTANAGIVWSRNNTESAYQPGLPVKMLDGYPVRGDVTLSGIFKTDVADTAHVFGYYYRVGQGEVVQPARRSIGLNLSPMLDAGVPISFLAGEKKVIHKFEKGRIDEISLAFQKAAPDVADPTAFLRFEDAGGVLIPGTQPVTVRVLTIPDFLRNPASPYSFYQIPLGGSPAIPTLAQLSVESDGAPNELFFTHGYFTRH
jgi:hypothetical protein